MVGILDHLENIVSMEGTSYVNWKMFHRDLCPIVEQLQFPPKIDTKKADTSFLQRYFTVIMVSIHFTSFLIYGLLYILALITPLGEFQLVFTIVVVEILLFAVYNLYFAKLKQLHHFRMGYDDPDIHVNSSGIRNIQFLPLYYYVFKLLAVILVLKFQMLISGLLALLFTILSLTVYYQGKIVQWQLDRSMEKYTTTIRLTIASQPVELQIYPTPYGLLFLHQDQSSTQVFMSEGMLMKFKTNMDLFRSIDLHVFLKQYTLVLHQRSVTQGQLLYYFRLIGIPLIILVPVGIITNNTATLIELLLVFALSIPVLFLLTIMSGMVFRQFQLAEIKTNIMQYNNSLLEASFLDKTKIYPQISSNLELLQQLTQNPWYHIYQQLPIWKWFFGMMSMQELHKIVTESAFSLRVHINET